MGLGTDRYAFSFGIADSSLVLFADGELDAEAAGDLLERLDTMRSRHVCLDLSAVTFIDVAILCALATAHRHHERAGGSITLRNVQPGHLRLLRLGGLTDLLRIEIPLDPCVPVGTARTAHPA
jgi:anti-anti-sigma factor